MTDTIDTATSSATAAGGTARNGALSTLRLPELQALASQLGVKGTSKMRKGDLVDVIRARTGEQGASERPAASRRDTDAATAASRETNEAPVASGRGRSRRAERPAASPAAGTDSPATRQDAPSAASREERTAAPVLDLPVRADEQHTEQRGERRDGRRDARSEAAAAVAEALGEGVRTRDTANESPDERAA
ncbi:MAG: Rho termination factor N-terminal domain-containing protein, partial [Cellulosimicrobium funkei]|uniref:Rho termination factor N-terminal domain-containing protein n=1 Tax=Cellulosimicrobium funkei TaxID=264251 RepID=UPI003F94A003